MKNDFKEVINNIKNEIKTTQYKVAVENVNDIIRM